MKRVLITGGLGFQGLHVAVGCARAGHHVTVLNTPSERARTTMLHALRGYLPTTETIQVVLGSVTDGDTMEKAVAGQDAVIHMAAWASVDQSLDRPWPPFEVNGYGTLAVLDAVRRFGQPGMRTVIASSCEVYGPTQMIILGGLTPPRAENVQAHDVMLDKYCLQDETYPMLPRSPYAASKIAGDRMAYAYAVTYGLDLVILRPSNIYGPWQRHGGFGAVIPTFVNRATYGQPLTITGGGLQFREFLHVDDVVRAYLAALEAPGPFHGEAFNVGSGELVTIHALAEQVAAHFDPAPPITFSDARVADVSGFLLDSTKMHHTFGWAPTVKFADGLAAYVAWTREIGKAAWK